MIWGVSVINKCILKYYSSCETEPPYEVASHRHDFWEMVYYGGLGISTVNSVPLNYLPGTYVIIPKDVPHAEKALARGALYTLGFEAELAIDEFPTMLFFDDEQQSIRQTLETIGDEIKMEPAFYSQRISLLMRDVLIRSLRSCATKSKKDDNKLDMIINYIDTYCTMDIDFRDLSNSMNYSYDHLRHYFKTKKGISLKQYVTIKRMDLAKEKLATGMPVARVAERCGFSSAAHFSAMFKKFTGISPSEYQKSCLTIPVEHPTIFIDQETE